MSIVFDALIVLIVATTMYVVIKKGFIRTILDFVSVFFAIVFAKMFSPELSQYIYNKFGDTMVDKLNNSIANMIETNTLPSILEENNLSDYLKIYNTNLSNQIESSVLSNTVDSISHTLVGLISYVVALGIIFVVTMIVFKVLSILLSGIFKLPVLKSINKALSIVLGIIISLFYVLVFTAFVQVAFPFLTSFYPENINQNVIDNTLIFKHIYNFEWIKFFVN